MCLNDNKMVTGYYDANENFKRNIVDHKIPIKVDWSLRLIKSNCWVLCQSCHNKKTRKDKNIYG
ncbi:HNH endonuclease [Lysinibacillus sphaericus]|uniref:HNH endonuclease n=1 Tax=Lysinibacillus sphaericus TaxID=1421 RepID=UPI003CFCCE57